MEALTLPRNQWQRVVSEGVAGSLVKVSGKNVCPNPWPQQVRKRYGTGTGQVRDRYGTGTGHVRDRYGTGTGQVRNRYGTDTGQVRDRYGTGTGQVRNRYGTGTEKVRNRYGKGTEQVRDRYGTGTEQVRDRFGTGTGQVRNRYGTSTEQVPIPFPYMCEVSRTFTETDTCRYLFRTWPVQHGAAKAIPYRIKKPTKEVRKFRWKVIKKGNEWLSHPNKTFILATVLTLPFTPSKATPKHKLEKSILATVSATCFCVSATALARGGSLFWQVDSSHGFCHMFLPQLLPGVNHCFDPKSKKVELTLLWRIQNICLNSL